MVSGNAFLINIGKPFLKLEFISFINEIECLIECKDKKIFEMKLSKIKKYKISLLIRKLFVISKFKDLKIDKVSFL